MLIKVAESDIARYQDVHDNMLMILIPIIELYCLLG